MPKATIENRAKARTDRPRKWGNRRPASKRLDLPPEEAEKKEETRRGKYARKFLSVRLTDPEKATVARRASVYGMKVSDYARTVLLSDLKEPPAARTDPKALMALSFELSKVGTNLNQLARRANEAAKLGQGRDVAALLSMGKELRALTGQIAAATSKVIAL